MQSYWLSIKRCETIILFSDPASKSTWGLYQISTDVLVAFGITSEEQTYSECAL